MRIVVAGVTGVLLLAGCASLLTPSGSAAARWAALEKARAAKANPSLAENKICKNMTVMGSNFPQRVCSTAAEWDEFNEQQIKTAEEFDAARRSGNTEGGFERGN